MSNAVIGALRVVFGADTAAFEKGVTKAERSANNFEKRMGKVGQKVKVAGAAAAAGVTAAFTSTAKTVIEETEKIKTLTDSLDMPFEQFQRDVFAAKVVGIEMEKLGDIFRDTEDKIGDFIATGQGPMVDFFENIGPKVGVTAEAFKGLSGKESLQLYFDSLKKANVSQEEMIFYLEAIASDATNLIPLLENGGKAWETYGAKAAVVTEEQAAKTREYTIRMMELEQGWKSFVIQTLELIDQVSIKYTQAQKFFYDTGENIRASIRNIPDAFGEAVDRVRQYFANLVASVSSYASEIFAGMVQLGRDIVRGIVNGIKAAPSAVYGALKDVVGFGVKNIKEYLQIRSPSRLFMGIGSFIAEGLAKGIRDGGAMVSDATESLAEKAEVQTVTIRETFKDMAQGVVDSLTGLSNSIKSGGFLNILGSVLDLGLQLGSIGLFGSKVATNINRPRSFDGGGYTGGGSRAGGIDGKGGFLAMLHPQETVIDHTKGAMGSMQTVQVVPSPYFDVVVDGRVQRAAPGIAQSGASLAGAQSSRMQKRRVRR